MPATRESIKYFFETPKRLMEDESVAEILEKARRMHLSVVKTTAVLTGMPGGGGADRSTKLARYVDSVDDCAWALNLIEEARENNAKLISSAVLTDRQRAVLTLRYVKNQTCIRAATRLGMDLRNFYRVVNSGLDACAAYVTLEKPDYAKGCLT